MLEFPKGELGNDPLWFVFTYTISRRFRNISDVTSWDYFLKRFRQGSRETVVDFGQRFDDQVMDTHPVYSMGDLHKM